MRFGWLRAFSAYVYVWLGPIVGHTSDAPIVIRPAVVRDLAETAHPLPSGGSRLRPEGGLREVRNGACSENYKRSVDLEGGSRSRPFLLRFWLGMAIWSGGGRRDRVISPPWKRVTPGFTPVTCPVPFRYSSSSPPLVDYYYYCWIWIFFDLSPSISLLLSFGNWALKMIRALNGQICSERLLKDCW